MDKLRGVMVELTKDGQVLEVEPDGYVGELTNGQAVITATVLRGHPFIGIDVDGAKNVTPKKNWSRIEGLKVFQAQIPIKTGKKGGVNHTEYPDNNLRLLEVRRNGQVALWEISLISQEGYFFLTTQKVYCDQCYRKGDRIFCAPFTKWPQLVGPPPNNKRRGITLTELIPLDSLKSVSEYRKIQAYINLPPNTGSVLWFNLSQGYGLIITPDGKQARVHWRQIIREGRLAFFETGDLVSYKYLMKPNQTKARKTTFPREAYVVTLL